LKPVAGFGQFASTLLRGSYYEPASHVIDALRSFSVWLSPCEAIPGDLHAAVKLAAGRGKILTA
jgi:hypothetical protein